MSNMHFSLLFILISFLSFSYASLLIPKENITFPSIYAKELSRSFNLHPDNSAATQSTSFADSINKEEQLVEKQINLIEDPSSEPKASLGHYAGYYRLPHSYDARFFYLFFESRHRKDDPVVIWLTGGPGCSSELALFYENGPLLLSKNLSLVWNDYGWDKASNLLYVDQPTGTGFSYSSDTRDIRRDETGVSNDLYDFLLGFFAKHPEYVKNDFYITGESYAGHYIPALASRVHQGNKANKGLYINLKGFAIGNGLTNPEIQYNAYTDYALEMNLITKSDYNEINMIYPECLRAIKLCETSDDEDNCVMAFNKCNAIINSILNIAGDINYYDIRKKCEGNLCYNFSGIEEYLNQQEVKKELGVPANLSFVSCSGTVYAAMMGDWVRNLEVGIPSLLEDGIKVLIYVGEYDFICNWLGNSRWVYAMEWSGQKDFVAASNQSFIVDGKEAGVLTSHGPLSLLKVHNAGHMVPMDQPKAALEMLTRWTQTKLTSSNTR